MNNRRPFEFISEISTINQEFNNAIEELSSSKEVSIESDKKNK